MKIDKKILESISKGIHIALDDYELDDIENISSKSNVVKNDEYVRDLIRYTKLRNLFDCFVACDVTDKNTHNFLGKNELQEFIDLSFKLNIKYKFKHIDRFKNALSNIYIYNSEANLNWIDVSNITDMSWLFHGTRFEGDISEWDVSNVTNMRFMFDNSIFNGDISKWDVSNVTNMQYMFYNSKFNGDISKWNVSNVEDMRYMFANDFLFDQDLSQWNMKKIRGDFQVSQMFINCKIQKEHKPKYMKYESHFVDVANRGGQKIRIVESKQCNLELDNFDDFEYVEQKQNVINNVEYTKNKIIYEKYMPLIMNIIRYGRTIDHFMTYKEYNQFVDATLALDKKIKFRQDPVLGDDFKILIQNIVIIEEFNNANLNWIDTSEITNMGYLFANLRFNGDISDWDVRNVKYMEGMFANSNFNGDISKWDVSNVERFDFMFNNSVFNQNISKWNVSNAKRMGFMFANSKFNQDMRNWNWQILDDCNVCAMFSRSDMDTKFIPSKLKKMIIKQTINGLG